MQFIALILVAPTLVCLVDNAILPVAKRLDRHAACFELPEYNLKALWDQLDAPNASQAWRAMQTLAASPDQVLRVVRRELFQPAKSDSARVERLLVELNDTRFEVRQLRWSWRGLVR
jgi:hypothetical protein